MMYISPVKDCDANQITNRSHKEILECFLFYSHGINLADDCISDNATTGASNAAPACCHH